MAKSKRSAKTTKLLVDNRTSTGSINLAPLMSKKALQKDDDPFKAAYLNPSGASEVPKYDRLYNMHKKQIDRQDKTKEDYEFER